MVVNPEARELINMMEPETREEDPELDPGQTGAHIYRGTRLPLTARSRSTQESNNSAAASWPHHSPQAPLIRSRSKIRGCGAGPRKEVHPKQLPSTALTGLDRDSVHLGAPDLGEESVDFLFSASQTAQDAVRHCHVRV